MAIIADYLLPFSVFDNLMLHPIMFSYTEETIQKNVDEFGKDKIMCLEGVHEIDKQKTKQSTKKKER